MTHRAVPPFDRGAFEVTEAQPARFGGGGCWRQLRLLSGALLLCSVIARSLTGGTGLSSLFECPGLNVRNDRFCAFHLAWRHSAGDVAIKVKTRPAGSERTLIQQSKAISEEQGAAFIGQQYA